MRNILVTGACGYVGTALLEGLAADGGFRVTAIDSGLTASTELGLFGVEYHAADVRDVKDWRGLLRGKDGVVHLAAVVGDPACGVAPKLAWEVNYLGTVALAEECKRAGVNRLVFASTCSNYGRSPDGAADISAPLFPQSDYAMSKIHAEHHLLANGNGSFLPVILRFATLYGLSPRMRFDLAVNAMTAAAVTDGKVTVHGGEQWRPFLHVRDAARSLRAALDVTPDVRAAQVYNAGSDSENYRILDIARLIVERVPGASVTVEGGGADARDYRVDFSRIAEHLGFTPTRRVPEGIREIADTMLAGRYGDWTDARYSTVATVTNALDTGSAASATRFEYDWPRLGLAGVA